MNNSKKQSNLKQLMAYAGGHRYLTYSSLLLSVVSAVLALFPFVFLFLIIQEVIAVRPDWAQAVNIVHNGWLAVLFALLSIVVYFGALMCSHLSAFRIAGNIRKTLMAHIARLPLGFVEAMGSGKIRRIVNDSSAATETFLAHQLPDMAAADGHTVTVKAEAVVNGHKYTTTADFTVKLDDSYVLDIAEGNIIVEEDTIKITKPVTQGKFDPDVVIKEYSRGDKTKPIRIWQSEDGILDKCIQVASGVQADITLDNLRLDHTTRYPDRAVLEIEYDADVNLTLVGNNELSLSGGMGGVYSPPGRPAVYVKGSSRSGGRLTIDGDGSLTLRVAQSEGNTSALGGYYNGEHGDIIINGGRITAYGNKKAPAVGTGLDGTTTQSRIIINGGLLLAVRGAETDAQNPRDIKTDVIINGGSVATLNAQGEVVPDVCFYAPNSSGKPSALPQNSAGAAVYRTVLQLADAQPNAEVTYWVKEGSGEEQGPYKAFTDANSKLYLYLPASGAYQRIRAEVGEDTYYKRMVIKADNDNTGKMIKATDAQITKFAISGQLGETVIDHTARTIELTMPAGMDISKVTPTVETEGAEYKPTGAMDFGNSLENPLEYIVIDDSGREITYKVMVTQRPLAPGEKTVLDVANGNIRMLEMQNGTITVTVGGMAILPNPNGYVITGHNDNATVYIDGISAPIVLRDLDLAIDGSSSAYRALEFYPHYNIQNNTTDNYITIEGVNTIHAKGTKQAVYFNAAGNSVISNYTFDGEGILKFTADQRAAVGGDRMFANFIIEGGNISITDGANAAAAMQAKNRAGEPLYPVTITIDDPQAAGQVVSYQDNLMAAPKKILADEAGQITVWRKNALYSCTVSCGENNESVCHGSVQVEGKAESITVGVPEMTRFTNKMPQSALGNKRWCIEITGKYLGGNMVVTATGENGEQISGKPVQLSESLWAVYLDIPDNDHLSEYTYTLSATIEGVPQTNVQGDTSFTMLGELRMSSFKIIQLGYQVGDEEFGEDENGHKYVHVNVAYDVDLEQARISALMKPDEAFFSPNNGQRLVFRANPRYGGTHTQLYQVSNNILFGAGDTVEYLVTLYNQPTPVVNGVSVSEVDYHGGTVEVSLFGENFGSLLNAANYQSDEDPSKPFADRIYVTVNGTDYELTADEIRNGKTKLEVSAPDNSGGTQSKHYPLTVSINGVEQEITSFNGQPLAEGEVAEIVVPGELEMDATIRSLSFVGQLDYETGNPMGYDKAVIKHNGDNEAGTIDVTVPWRTELCELAPYIRLTNEDATYTPTGALSEIPGGEDNPVSASVTITVTAVKGNTKDYVLTITRIPTPEEHSAVIKSFKFGEQLLYEPSNPMGYDQAVINDEAGTIDIITPWRTKLAELTPIIELAHEDAVYTPTGALSQLPDGEDNPVSASVTYTVTAVDGTTKDYEVTITRVATRTEKDPTIHSIYMANQLSSAIEQEPNEQGMTKVQIDMPRGTDMTALTPELRLGHEDAVYEPEGPQDFSNSVEEPVVYTVTAVDGTTMQYAVSVELKHRSGEADNGNVSRTIDEENFSAYIDGKEDGLFHPDDEVSRSEAATMMARMHEKFDKTAKYDSSFTDVPEGAWYAAYVGFLAQQGIVLGDGGRFMPDDLITRMEFAAMLTRFAELPTDTDSNTAFKDTENVWGQNEIRALVDQGVIQGYEDGTFRPNKNLSRAEAVSMLNRLMKRGTTKEELAALSNVENPFADVDEEHWAYTDILNAVTGYSRKTDTWIVGSGKEVTVTVDLDDKTKSKD